jgi:hypothetical protein
MTIWNLSGIETEFRTFCRRLQCNPLAVESPHAGVRIQTGRVTHWQNDKMVIRWLASAFIRTEKRLKRIVGHRDLWTLEAILNDVRPAAERVAA